MHEQWALIWMTGLRERGRDKTRSLDDPLDRPEWDGLRWTLAVFSFLQSLGSRGRPHSARAWAEDKPRYRAVVVHPAIPAVCSDEPSLSR